MKKIIFAFILALSVGKVSTAQSQFGLKAGINYNSDSFSNVSDDVLSGADSKTGYHAGIWFRAKLPVTGLYIRPEIIYTELKNQVAYDNSLETRATDFKFRKIDVPILLGKKILKAGNIFAGPSFQYALSSDLGLNDLSEASISKFSLGIQLGGGLEFGKLGIDVRWERSLSKTEIKFVDNHIDKDVNFDNRVNQIIFGISYRL